MTMRALAWLLLAGIGLAACSATTSPRSTGSPSPATPTPPPPTAAAPTPSSSFLPAVGTVCTAQQLTARSAGEVWAGASNAMAVVIFTDRGPGPCVLRGTPVVHFLDATGRTLDAVSIRATTDGQFPIVANGGVGLTPLPASSVLGIRGQAGLPLQYTHQMCATSIAAIAVTLPSGTLTAQVQGALKGSDFAGCLAPVVFVNPFQPAEWYH